VEVLSLEEAYSQYADELVRYAAVLVSPWAADDVVADTFADLLHRPDGAWARARDHKAFLFGAVANQARMHHRSNGRRRQREQRVATLVRAHPGPTIDDDPRASGERLDVLDVLSVQQRAVIYLTYWQDLSVAQVAEVLGVTDGTVRRQLARARARLRRALT
jgi:RNA polymerase sigma-70 factor (ECF subfamily)